MVVGKTTIVVKDFDMHGCVRVLDRYAECLIPLGIEVLVDDAALVALLAGDLELDVRVTGAYNSDTVTDCCSAAPPMNTTPQ